jgi:hypothetical protein
MGSKPATAATKHPHLHNVASTSLNVACFGFHGAMELTPALKQGSVFTFN